MDATKYCPNPECSFRRQHGIPAEYELEVVQCLDCETPLQIGPAPPDGSAVPRETEPAGARPPGMVPVATFPDPFEAGMALSWLRDSGIEAILTNRDGVAVIPAIAHGAGVLRVPQADLDRAARLLEDLQSGEGGQELPEDFFDEEPDEDAPKG